jgi:hypothetical protein
MFVPGETPRHQRGQQRVLDQTVAALGVATHLADRRRAPGQSLTFFLFLEVHPSANGVTTIRSAHFFEERDFTLFSNRALFLYVKQDFIKP